jgi:hypothetical protein
MINYVGQVGGNAPSKLANPAPTGGDDEFRPASYDVTTDMQETAAPTAQRNVGLSLETLRRDVEAKLGRPVDVSTLEGLVQAARESDSSEGYADLKAAFSQEGADRSRALAKTMGTSAQTLDNAAAVLYQKTLGETPRTDTGTGARSINPDTRDTRQRSASLPRSGGNAASREKRRRRMQQLQASGSSTLARPDSRYEARSVPASSADRQARLQGMGVTAQDQGLRGTAWKERERQPNLVRQVDPSAKRGTVTQPIDNQDVQERGRTNRGSTAGGRRGGIDNFDTNELTYVGTSKLGRDLRKAGISRAAAEPVIGARGPVLRANPGSSQTPGGQTYREVERDPYYLRTRDGKTVKRPGQMPTYKQQGKGAQYNESAEVSRLKSIRDNISERDFEVALNTQIQMERAAREATLEKNAPTPDTPMNAPAPTTRTTTPSLIRRLSQFSPW